MLNTTGTLESSPGAGGGVLIEVLYGRICHKVQLLTLLYTIF